MRGITNFFSKSRSRQNSTSLDEDDNYSNSDLLNNGLSSAELQSPNTNVRSKAIPIERRSSCSHRYSRGESASSYERSVSPRDRYDHIHTSSLDYHDLSSDYNSQYGERRRRYEADTNCSRSLQKPRQNYRNFVSPLFDDVMDEAQESEFLKCERYGEISNLKLSETDHADGENVLKNFTDTVTRKNKAERRRTTSTGSSTGSGSFKNSIHGLIRTFSKKLGQWRYELGEGRRASCAVPETTVNIETIEKKRSRSKSLDAQFIHKLPGHSILDDCGATYEIFDAILREGNILK